MALCCLQNVKPSMHCVLLNEIITQLEKGLRSLINTMSLMKIAAFSFSRAYKRLVLNLSFLIIASKMIANLIFVFSVMNS